MRKMLFCGALLGVVALGCSTVRRVSDNLTRTDPETGLTAPELIGRGVNMGSEGTPVEGSGNWIAWALGGLASLLAGGAALKARKTEKETDEIWTETHVLKGEKA